MSVSHAGYELCRSHFDKHILNSFQSQLEQIRSVVAKCRSLEEIAALIRTISKSSRQIDSFDHRVSPTAEILGQMIGPDLVRRKAEERNVSYPEAVAILIKSGNGCPEKLSWLAAAPPKEIHSMQRGEYWIGDTYSADMVISAFNQFGVDISTGSFLDYGCSSGPMLRVLSACFANTCFYGSDPVDGSIRWAQENLKSENLTFFRQMQKPPLPFADSSIDMIASISIFSHHGPNAASVWFAELARVLKPGGKLFFTAHGVGAILYYIENKMTTLDRSIELYSNFLSTGFVFEEPWIGSDEVGNIATDMEWGQSFYEPKVIAQLCDKEFVIIGSGLRTNQGNQDFYILERR